MYRNNGGKFKKKVYNFVSSLFLSPLYCVLCKHVLCMFWSSETFSTFLKKKNVCVFKNILWVSSNMQAHIHNNSMQISWEKDDVAFAYYQMCDVYIHNTHFITIIYCSKGGSVLENHFYFALCAQKHCHTISPSMYIPYNHCATIQST